MTSFQEILAKDSLFMNTTVLSPHYLPSELPFRDKQISDIMTTLSPALKDQKPRNLFLYGKTGTGKTCTVKHVMQKFNQTTPNCSMCYINARIYNSRYRIMQKLIKQFDPSMDKSGFGLPQLYEKLLELLDAGRQIVLILDEIDMIKDLDELVYTLTRVNDEVKKGGLTIIGISNRLSFKNELDPRSKSSLYETEMVFPPYTSIQLKHILNQRISEGFKPNAVDVSAINLAAAITAQESGDARFALKLLMKAGELAEQKGKKIIKDEDVENARKKVEIDVLRETVDTLPEHHQMVLFSISKLSSEGGNRYTRLDSDKSFEGYLLSGEVYEDYTAACNQTNKRNRTTRWFKEYLNDLEMLGFITSKMSSKGIRGHSTMIKMTHDPKEISKLLEKTLL